MLIGDQREVRTKGRGDKKNNRSILEKKKKVDISQHLLGLYSVLGETDRQTDRYIDPQ